MNLTSQINSLFLFILLDNEINQDDCPPDRKKLGNNTWTLVYLLNKNSYIQYLFIMNQHLKIKNIY